MTRPYHHGDLRAALLEAGLRRLAERTAAGVSLRELARDAGVSPTAVYRHFPDKAALLRALAAEGLERLAQAQHAAMTAAGDGPAGFAATGRAYVRFALAHPALFRLVFASGIAPAGGEEPEASRLLRRNAAREAGENADPDAVEVVALRNWAGVHGLAMLMLDGLLPQEEALIDRLIADRSPPEPAPRRAALARANGEGHDPAERAPRAGSGRSGRTGVVRWRFRPVRRWSPPSP